MGACIRNAVFLMIAIVGAVNAAVHPITIQGRYFIDSITKEPVHIP